MRKIVIDGWNAGFKKVSMTKLLHERANYSLSHAKAVTDTILNHQQVAIELPDNVFEQIVAELKDINVKFTQE